MLLQTGHYSKHLANLGIKSYDIVLVTMMSKLFAQFHDASLALEFYRPL